jgi:hypothetical protein
MGKKGQEALQMIENLLKIGDQCDRGANPE